MSRRRSSKRGSRERSPRSDAQAWYVPAPPLARETPVRDDTWPPAPWNDEIAAPTPQACGRCREFVEGTDLGRGTCLHPASGVLGPWPDTPACDYYRGRRV